VVAPALIAGFFAILPTIYNELTKPRTILSYNVVSGPSIPADHKYLRIFSIAIENTGKTPLDKISLEISSINGDIANLVAEKSALHPTIINDPSVSVVSAQRMLPGDHLNVSVMTRSDTGDPLLTANVRSDAVLGIKQDLEKRPTSSIAVLGASLSAVSVAVMSLLTWWEVFRRRRRWTGGERLRDLMVGGESREDMVTWILGLSQVLPLGEQILLTKHNFTYARTGDIFLFNALNRGEEIKQRCIAGLRSLLLVDRVAEDSVTKLRENLKILGIEYSDAEFTRMRAEAARRSGFATRRAIFEIFGKCSSGNRASEVPEGSRSV
jgi:hypothetical protein